jgi:hypothetical protein
MATENDPFKNSGAFGTRPKSSGGSSKRKKKGHAKDVVKSAEKLGERTGRRSTTDPFTTHVAMEEFITARQGLMRGEIKFASPSPDLAPRMFPGARTLFGTPEKLLGIEE